MDTFPSTLLPSEIKALEKEYNTDIIVFENEYEQRFANTYTGKQRFTFRWNAITPAEKSSLQTFFDNQLGRYKKWTITDSRIGTVQLRFDADKIKFSSIKQKAFNAEIKVVTC